VARQRALTALDVWGLLAPDAMEPWRHEDFGVKMTSSVNHRTGFIGPDPGHSGWWSSSSCGRCRSSLGSRPGVRSSRVPRLGDVRATIDRGLDFVVDLACRRHQRHLQEPL